MPEYCKGCITYIVNNRDALTNNDDPIICSYTNHNKDGKCPCSSCIIKMMCEITCDEYEDFVDIVDGVGM